MVGLAVVVLSFATSAAIATTGRPSTVHRGATVAFILDLVAEGAQVVHARVRQSAAHGLGTGGRIQRHVWHGRRVHAHHLVRAAVWHVTVAGRPVAPG
ncbi:hypothetical protein HYQ46_010304 [Verticillium longisporum]|nr:hypothetical protein HYQ46_010304 [Verticillium longisporum]